MHQKEIQFLNRTIPLKRDKKIDKVVFQNNKHCCRKRKYLQCRALVLLPSEMRFCGGGHRVGCPTEQKMTKIRKEVECVKKANL